MSKTELFIEKVNNTYPNQFIVLGEYKNNRTKVLVRHLTCEEEYEIYPYDFLNGRYSICSTCSRKEKMYKRLDSYLEENKLSDYSYSKGTETYQKEKCEFYHEKCNNPFPMSIDSFLQGQRCPYCMNMKTNKNSAQMKIDNLTTKGEFIILNEEDEITAHDSQVRLLHMECQRTTETTLSYFVVQNPACFHCTKEKYIKDRRKTHEEFLIELESVFGDEYKPIDRYITAITYIDFYHTPCGNILNLRPNSILSMNSGCKYCNMSSPERAIDSILKEYEIDYEIQYKFDNCRGERKTRLPFDFAIFKNGFLELIIEYDGEHHSHENAFGKESYERTVRNDRIKNDYCKKENIKLVRIPFTEKNNLRAIVIDIIKGNGLSK